MNFDADNVIVGMFFLNFWNLLITCVCFIELGPDMIIYHLLSKNMGRLSGVVGYGRTGDEFGQFC